MSRQQRMVRLLTIVALGLTYFAAGRFGLDLAFVNASATAIWPPTGLTLAAFLIFGYWIWPGIFLGALAVNLTVSDAVPAALIIAVGNTLEGVVGAYLVDRFANGRHAFERGLDIAKFILLVGVLATPIAATVGVGALDLAGLASAPEHGRIWLTWWFGDLTGALIVTPLLLLWSASVKRWQWSIVLETMAVFAVLIGVSLALFGGKFFFSYEFYPVQFFAIPLIVWIAARIGARATATAMVVFSGIALWGTLHGFGSFARFPPNQALLLLQGFVSILGMTGLGLAAVVGQRRQVEQALRDSEEHYRIVTQTAIDVIVTIDGRGVIQFVNPAAKKMFGYSVAQLLGRNLTMLMPKRLREVYQVSLERYQRTGESHLSWSDVELTAVHKDGHEFPIDVSFGEFKHGKQHLFIGVMRDISERKRAEERLRWFATIVESSSEAIIGVNKLGIVQSWNAAAERLYGYAAAEIIGRSVTLIAPPERTAETRDFLERLHRGERVEQETERMRKDGSRFQAALSISPIMDATGVMVGAATIARDITEHKRIEEQQRWLATIVESSSDAIIGKSLDGTILSWNRGAERLYGYTAAEAIGQPISMLSLPEQRDELPSLLERLQHGELVHDFELERVTKDGRRLNVSLTVSPIRDASGAICGASTIAHDVTERRRAEEHTRYLAQHDTLTGLPNRLLFRDRIGQAIAHAYRQHEQMAVLFLDLDGFKHINDSLGHEIGDKMLCLAAQRLQQCLRAEDSVARLGGDEFVISLPGLADGSDAMPTANKILEALREPFPIDSHALHVSGSIGISIYPADGTDAEALMRAADTAMYHAKENGRNNFQFYTARLNEAAHRRLNIANLLHQALERRELTLCFQPQVDLQSGRITAAEALVRWRQSDLGAVSPNEFIKIAEETGLIVPIGEWVLRQACYWLKHWRDRGYPQLRMTINLSPQQFRRPGFPDTAARILAENALPAGAIDLEITESVLMTQTEDNLAILEQLAGMGIRMAVDDFGIGYSNLAYLQRFPIHTLKIDRSFVCGIGSDANDTTLVAAIIAMAHSLRLDIIGEGVENAEQAAFLKAHGCKAAQGFYFGEAVSADTFGAQLREPPFGSAEILVGERVKRH